MTGDISTPKNLLLQKLPRAPLRKFLAVAEFVHLNIRENVFEPNKKIEFVDFPETGVTSIVSPMDDGLCSGQNSAQRL